MIKCEWGCCNGWLDRDGYCVKCGRSGDLEYEKRVAEQQLNPHHNHHSNWTLRSYNSKAHQGVHTTEGNETQLRKRNLGQ
jgi:hypothetical protein